MKSQRPFFLSTSFNKMPLFSCLAVFLCLFISPVMAQVTGDYKSKASGDWATPSTWQYYNGTAWVNAGVGQYPGGTSEATANNVFLEAGYTITLSSNNSCKNLNLSSTADVVRINTQGFVLDVWGKLRFYNGAAPGTTPSSLAGVTNWISTGTTDGTGSGRIRYRGTVDRSIIVNGDVNANATSIGYQMEVAFDAGKKATIDFPIRAGYAIISSGILKVNPTFSLRVSGDASTTIAGTMTVKTGATLIGGQFFQGTSAPMQLFTLESGAFLYFENTTLPVLATQTAVLNGTVGLIGSTTTFPSGGARPGSATINVFNDLIISGTGSKTLQNNVTVNGKLSLGGTTASIALNTFALSYGSSGSLEYNGTVAQTTSTAEFPATGGPNGLIINNPLGVSLNNSSTIQGPLTLTSGLFQLGNNDFTLGQNSPAVAGVPTAANMVVTNGTGTLRKVFSAAGTFFYPIGETTGTAEYTYGSVTVNSAAVLNGSTYVGLRVIDNYHPAASGATDKISRYWGITSNMSSINYGTTFQYLTNDVTGTESSLKSHLYADETALSAGAPNGFANSIAHRIVYTGLTSVGFATGINQCSISNNTVNTPTTTSYCATSGTLPAFVASTAAVTSGSPAYQWQISVNAGAFADITTNGQSKDYAEPAALTAGVYKYRRVVGDPSSCLASEANVSNEIAITVVSALSNNTVGSDQTVISGNAASVLNSTATLSGGTGSYTYQWQSATVSGGPYTDISVNGALSSYDPGNPTTSTYYVRNVTSGACTSVSNEVSVIVPICSITNNSINATVTDYCVSGTPAINGSTAVVTSGTPVYQWQVSVDGGSYADVASGGQNEDYTSSSALTPAVYKYKRITSDPLSCQPANTSESNEVTIIISSSISSNTIGSDQTVISGDAASTLTQTAGLSGGTGTYSFQWQSSSVSGGPYTDITVDGTLASYDPGNPTSSAYYVRTVTSGACTSVSNEVSVIVPVCSITNNSVNATVTDYCASGAPTIDGSTAVVTSGTPVYQWQVSIDGGTYADVSSGGQNEDYTSSSLTPAVYKYKRITSDPLSCQSSNTSESNEVTITITAGISGNSIGSDQSITDGDAAALLTASGTLTGGDGTYTYQWQSSATSGGPYADVAIGNGALADYDPTSPSATIYFVRNVASDGCTSVSNEVEIIVSPITGIDGTQNSLGIELYPNPVVDILTVKFNSLQTGTGNLNLVILNSLGMSVSETAISTSNTLSIDLSAFSQGIYFANFIQEGKSVSVYKIVKR